MALFNSSMSSKKTSLPRLVKHMSPLFFSFVKTDFANSFQPQPRCRYYSHRVKKLRRTRDYAKICYFFCVYLCMYVCVCFCAYSCTLFLTRVDYISQQQSYSSLQIDTIMQKWITFSYFLFVAFFCYEENESVWFWKNRSLMFTSALQHKYQVLQHEYILYVCLKIKTKE